MQCAALGPEVPPNAGFLLTTATVTELWRYRTTLEQKQTKKNRSEELLSAAFFHVPCVFFCCPSHHTNPGHPRPL